MSGHDVQRAVFRSIGASVCGALGGAAGNGLLGYVGGLILNKHHPDAGYNADEVALQGVVGGSIVSAAYALIVNLAKEAQCCQAAGEEEKEKNCHEAIGHLVLGVGLAMGSGALGRLILNDMATMEYPQTVASMATGYGVIAGSVAALVCYCYCCALCVGGGAALTSNRDNPENAVKKAADLEEGESTQRRPRRHSTRHQRQSAFSAIELPSFSTSAVALFKGQPSAAANDAKANLEAENVAEKRAGAALNV